MAGVPFEPVARLATTATAAAARELLVRREEFARAKSNAERMLRMREHGLSQETFRALRIAVRAGGVPAAGESAQAPEFAPYMAAANEVAAAELRLQESLDRELGITRAALLESTRTLLSPYLVLAGPASAMCSLSF